MPSGFRVLHYTYAVLMLVAGVDRFLHLLVDWNKYVAPLIRRRVPIPLDTFMDAVGVIQILVAALILVRPRLGGYVAAAFLLASVIDLLLIPGYFDVALRDLALAAGALALARLSPAPRATRRAPP